MIVFYTSHIDDKVGKLLDEDLHHCVNVLRIRESEQIFVTDGKGHLYHTIVKTITKKDLIFEVISFETFPQPIMNCIAIAPTKNADRIEWFVEKAIEIGIQNIKLVQTQRTERHHINLTRLEKICISAIKQSRQCYLPSIELFKSIESLLPSCTNFENKFIAHCQSIETPHLHQVLYNASGNSVILIGPEGDFTDDEIKMASNSNFCEVSLGKTRLRTETAGVFSACLIQSFC